MSIVKFIYEVHSEHGVTRYLKDGAKVYEEKKESFSHFEGQPNNERLLSIRFQDKCRFFEGEKGKERKVRTEYDDGKMHYFRGECGKEALCCIKLPCGQVQEYEGNMDDERLVSVRYTDGTVNYFQGGMNVEHCVKVVQPDGVIHHLEGHMGEERIVRKESGDGMIEFFTGDRHSECSIRVERANIVENGASGWYKLFASNFIFEGMLCNGKRHGFGKLFVDGFVAYEGQWFEDVIEEQRNATKAISLKRKSRQTEDVRNTIVTMHSNSAGLEGVPQCAICFDHLHHGDVSYAYIPCGHRAICEQCHLTLKKKWAKKCMLCNIPASLYRIF